MQMRSWTQSQAKYRFTTITTLPIIKIKAISLNSYSQSKISSKRQSIMVWVRWLTGNSKVFSNKWDNNLLFHSLNKMTYMTSNGWRSSSNNSQYISSPRCSSHYMRYQEEVKVGSLIKVLGLYRMSLNRWNHSPLRTLLPLSLWTIITPNMAPTFLRPSNSSINSRISILLPTSNIMWTRSEKPSWGSKKFSRITFRSTPFPWVCRRSWTKQRLRAALTMITPKAFKR